MKNPFRVALIGVGRIGQVHASNIAAHPALSLAYVVDASPSAAQLSAERFGGSPVQVPEEILYNDLIDAAVVAAPTSTHLELIEICVERGIPVLCEKPIDLNIQRVDEVMTKVRDSSATVSLGFNQRFDPSFAEVKRRLKSGEIGDPEHLLIISRDPGPPPADYIAGSGGIFLDMSIHDLDMARFLLGEIEEVSASGSQLFDSGAKLHGDYDSVVISLRAQSGALATIINSRRSTIGYDQRLELVGSKGILSVDNAPVSLVRVSTKQGNGARGPFIENFIERYTAAYARELDEFVSLLKGSTSFSPSYFDGRQALALADAALQSATMGVSIQPSEFTS